MNVFHFVFGATILVLLSWFSWKKPRLSSILIWSMLAAMLLTSVVLLVMPAPFLDKATWLSLSLPITWCGLQYWCYWAESQWQVLFGLISLSIVSAVLILNLSL